MTLFYTIVLLAALLLSGFWFSLTRLKAGNQTIKKSLPNDPLEKLTPMESVKSLSILPLVEYYTDDPQLKTEAGVAYLIKADDTTILLDVGFNKKKEHPSPLLHNAGVLGVSLGEIDMIVISHPHLDHLGGMGDQRNKTFSISQGRVALPEIPVYAPVAISPSAFNPGPRPTVVKAPLVLAKGVASIGVIPRNLYLMGVTEEQSLAIHVEGKGIVLVIGCGHQTIEKIIERAKALFDAPIYGIIGGLHFPVHAGRMMAGPFNIQNIVGTDRPPWRPINEQEVALAISAIKKERPGFIALSPHDSSDWSLEAFEKAFPGICHDLKAGKELRIS